MKLFYTAQDIVHTRNNLKAEASFFGSESCISCDKSKENDDLDAAVGIGVSNVLSSKIKNQIFEVLLDPVLCPKHVTNADVHLYFMKVSWSPQPLHMRLGEQDQQRFTDDKL